MGDSRFIIDLIKHSQQLERELNSSKDWNTAAFAATSMASATIARLESERDQLRKVADALMHITSPHASLNDHITAREAYNSLPHVIEMSTK